MGKINIYSTIDNTHEVIEAIGRICDIFPNCDFKKSIIIKEGEKLTPDYYISENDILFMRKCPSDVPTSFIVFIALTSIAMGVAFGIDANVKMQKLQKQLEDAQQETESIQQLPFIRGAANKTALGSSVQYLMGEMYNTPYTITNSFYEIGGTNGDTQYLNIILSAGCGKQNIKNILMGDLSILASNTAISSGVHSDIDIYGNTNNLIEICQPAETFTTSNFTKKAVSEYIGYELVHDNGESAEYLTLQAAAYTRKYEVCIQFNGLREYNTDTSSWDAASVTVTPEYSFDGENWTTFYFSGVSNNTFTFNSDKVMRFVASIEFGPNDAYNNDLQVRLSRSEKSDDSNIVDGVYCLYQQSFCYDNVNASYSEIPYCKPVENELINKTCRIGLRIVSTDSTESTLDEIHIISCGVARTWNGTGWNSSKTATRNPAAWILEVLTSDIHPHSKYSDDEINLNALGELYEYCETNQFYTDALITSGLKKSELITNILSSVNTDMFINNEGILDFAIDKIESDPVALLNAESIKSIKYAKSFTRKPDGIKASYVSRDTWQTATRYVMLDGGTKSVDDVISELSLNYVTNDTHAYKMAQRKMRQAILQPRTIEVDVGKEADYYPIYSKVLLQVAQLKQGIRSSVIQKVIYEGDYIAGVIIGDWVYFDSAYNYGVIIQAVTASGKRLIYREVAGTGKTNELYFTTPINNDGNILPIASNTLSFGLLDDNHLFTKITNEMKIFEIKPNGNDGYTLVLKDYNPAIYEYGTIPEYKSNITSTKTTKNENKVNQVTYEDLNKLQETVLRQERDQYGIRILSSLTESGNEKEVALFNGQFYIYTSGEWVLQKSADYLGIYSVSAPMEYTEGNYFLAGADFEESAILRTFNYKILATNAGKYFNVKHTFTKGYVYICKSGIWKRIEDRNDYRYIIATNDLIYTGSDVSPNLDAAIDKKMEDIETDEYLGPIEELPAEKKKGQYFTWAGIETTKYKKGYVYKCQKVGDELDYYELSTTDPENYNAYMTALMDCLEAQGDAVTEGFFGTIFCKALVTSNAMIQNLQTQIITLQNGGKIKSKSYDNGRGFMIDGDTGAAVFNGDNTISGTCYVDKLHFKTYYSASSTGFSNGDIWVCDL